MSPLLLRPAACGVPLLFACCAAFQFLTAQPAFAAQGVATAAIRGRVVAGDSSSIAGARIRVINNSTGYAVEVEVRAGSFLVQGLEVGASHTVTLSRPGFAAQTKDRIILMLGEVREADFIMRPAPLLLDTLIADADAMGSPSGSAATISDSLVQRLPTPNRNVYDFVSLAPQISTKVGLQRSGVSAAGSNLRFNNFLIDGTEERFVNANVSAAFNVGKSIPIEAVKAYQVLIAPYDVRYGDFAGALINTVTSSGTNELIGSTFMSWRNDRLGRRTEGDPVTAFDRLQYGFSLGGPIVRNRIHFFIAPEFQRFTFPVSGPFVGQSESATAPLPVSEADVARVSEIMHRNYALEAGSAGFVAATNPLRGLFARIDAAMPRWRSRGSFILTYSEAADYRFSRTEPGVFSFSSYQWALETGITLAAFRLQTDVGRNGAHNEIVLSRSGDWGNFQPNVRQPLVRVLVPGTSGNLIMLRAGTAESAQGRSGTASSLRIRDDLSVPLGMNHVIRLGVQAERFQSERAGVIGGYGIWTFASVDAFEQGVVTRYELRKALGNATTDLRGMQYAAWAGDDWRVGDRLLLTLGVRGDLLDMGRRAPFNPQVDSIFARRTDQMPVARIHLSPRLGFAWDVSGTQKDELRGGIGLFTGRPPLAWYAPALSSYGVGIGVLRCGFLPTDAGPPPAFAPDYRAAPTKCASGASVTTAPLGDVDLLDRKLRLAQSLRASLAYDRQLPWGLLATTEILLSRNVSDFIFVNMNLRGEQATDRFGRVLYGAIGPSGIAAPALRSGFAEVIDLRNTSRNDSYQLSFRVEKPFERGIAATASYTYSRVRDVQSPSRVNLAGVALWADARAVSGRHEDLARATSLNDLPHRVVTAITYRVSWTRSTTDFSLYYVGESGSPFTYLSHGINGRGDLNADGSNANDPLYVPRNAFDVNEILFTGYSDDATADNSPEMQASRVHAQQQSFTSYIERSACLREHRGRILARNRCREPATHTAVAAVRQTIPLGGSALEAGVDVSNVLNLLNRDWGHYRVAEPQLLEHVGQTVGTAGSTQPVFRFRTTRDEWTTLAAESAFQVQLTMRYRF